MGKTASGMEMVSFQLPAGLKRRLKERAKRELTTTSSLIRRLVSDYVMLKVG